MTVHPIAPVFDGASKILVLGSFPSIKSREEMFFYGHPQNRFWRVISAVFERPVPVCVEDKRDMLISCGVALWDVIASCDIKGSSDSTIRNVVPNDLSVILNTADIKQIYVNGKTAERYYNKYLRDKYGIAAICLPSTSPANAAWSFEKLVEAWSVIKP